MPGAIDISPIASDAVLSVRQADTDPTPNSNLVSSFKDHSWHQLLEVGALGNKL